MPIVVEAITPRQWLTDVSSVGGELYQHKVYVAFVYVCRGRYYSFVFNDETRYLYDVSPVLQYAKKLIEA